MSQSTRYHIRHLTRYVYGADVAHSHQLLHLVPRPAPYQECLEHAVDISPAPDSRIEALDAFGNPVLRVEFEHPHRRLEVVTRMDIRVHARPKVDANATHRWEQVARSLAYHGGWPARGGLDVCRFRHESPYVRIKRAFTDYTADCFEPGRPVLAAATALMKKLHQELRYAPGETTIATPLMEVLEQRRGVCQDYAHLMIACLRSRGLAARYVSGYIRSRPAQPAAAASAATSPIQTQTQSQTQVQTQTQTQAQTPPETVPAPALVGGDASHAWVAVYAPPLGWIELDPTNNVWVGADHVAVAWGGDFGDVSPLRGIILGGGSPELSVDVAVQPVPDPAP